MAAAAAVAGSIWWLPVVGVPPEGWFGPGEEEEGDLLEEEEEEGIEVGGWKLREGW